MTDLGPCLFYLGIEITRDRKEGTFRLSQRTYIEKVLKAFDMLESRPVVTLIDPDMKLDVVHRFSNTLRISNQKLASLNSILFWRNYYNTIINITTN